MGAEWRNTGPMCAYIRLKAKRADSKSCSSLSDVRGLRWLHPPSFAKGTHHINILPALLSCVCGSPWQDIPLLRHLQHRGVSSAIQSLLYELHTMASLGLLEETLPFHEPDLGGSPSPWRKVPWPLSACILHDSKSQNPVVEFCCLLAMEPGPLNHIDTSFSLLLLFRSRKFLRPLEV